MALPRVRIVARRDTSAVSSSGFTGRSLRQLFDTLELAPVCGRALARIAEHYIRAIAVVVPAGSSWPRSLLSDADGSTPIQ